MMIMTFLVFLLPTGAQIEGIAFFRAAFKWEVHVGHLYQAALLQFEIGCVYVLVLL